MLRRTALCAALCAGLLASSAAAQDRYQLAPPREVPTPAALREARSLFLAGSSAVESGRWADALDTFERSYTLSGVPAALYNVATALRSLGRHRDARDAFTMLLTRHREELDAPLRQEAEARRTEEAARVAVLALAGLPTNPALAVSLDGSHVADTGARPLEVETDAGQHAVRVELPSFRPWQWSGRLRDGQYETLEVRLEAAPVQTEGTSVFESPVFWILAGVVVVAGAAVAAYVIWDGAQLEPSSPNVVDVR